MEHMEKINVSLGPRSYPVMIGRGLIAACGEQVRETLGPCAAAIVTDDRVGPLFLAKTEKSLADAGLRTASIVLPHGEAVKSLDSLPGLYAFLAETGITRSDAVVALGGGVIGDLAGFAAATWLRGVRFVQIPTSLLAQVDASVGGKVAVDLPQGKNLVGAFWQPSLVLCDPDALTTLSGRFWRDGLGEVVKVGCIADEALFALLERTAPGGREALMARMDTILRRCIQVKADTVAQDERDTGRRMTLNFGHTVGHAVEVCEGYAGHAHGEAVAIGMAAVTRLSEARVLTAPGTLARLTALLEALGLPAALPAISEEALIAAIRRDKKNAGDTLRAVLLRRIGECFLYPTDLSFFRGMTAPETAAE